MAWHPPATIRVRRVICWSRGAHWQHTAPEAFSAQPAALPCMAQSDQQPAQHEARAEAAASSCHYWREYPDPAVAVEALRGP